MERCGTETVSEEHCCKHSFLRHLWSGSHTGVIAFPPSQPHRDVESLNHGLKLGHNKWSKTLNNILRRPFMTEGFDIVE